MNDRIVSVPIADRHAHARSAMRLLLAQEPDVVVVGEAADMDTAVSAIAARRPDVMLLDWELPRQSPGQNGDSAVSDWRAASSELFVIALSSLPEARQEALAAGADAFVSKGGPPKKLLAAVGVAGAGGRTTSIQLMLPTAQQAVSRILQIYTIAMVAISVGADNRFGHPCQEMQYRITCYHANGPCSVRL